MAQEDPVVGAKAVLKRTEPLAKLARETALVPREGRMSAPKPMKTRPTKTDEQPKGLRSNVALRRKLTSGR